jgi:peptidoglycan hydrolase-like protein with peptidoglycan-binding domain
MHKQGGTIMDSNLLKPVGLLHGKEDGNKREDVLKMQRALALAFCKPSPPASGKCDADTVEAIKDFQAAIGASQTGRVSSGDAALSGLAALLAGPSLRPITRKKIRHGGFLFATVKNVMPRNKYKMYLSFRNRSFAAGQNLRNSGEMPFVVDVTGRPHADLIGSDQLSALLAQIEKIGGTGAWGNKAYCVVYITRDDVVVSRSTGATPFDCPVKPYPGPIGDSSVPSVLDVTEADPVGPWTYTENGEAMKSGSMLDEHAFNGKYFFKYAGLFTIKNSLRGFDCTTYPGSIFGLPSTSMGSFDAICSAMMARPVGIEKVKLTAFLSFMETHTNDTYLVFVGGHHIVIISGGVCYEFNVGPNGRRPYKWDPFMVRKWSTTDHYTVRSIGGVVTDAPNARAIGSRSSAIA